MRIWLVKFDETLPVDVSPRLYRMGMLAEALWDAGHEVIWWCSTYNHQSSSVRSPQDCVADVCRGYQLRMLHTGSGCSRAVSWRRVGNNLRQAWRLRIAAQKVPRPDLIVCSMPTPELAWVSAGLGRQFGVPVVLDARDMWPDVFSDLLPALKHVAALPYISLMRAMLRSATRSAAGCTSITEPFLNWILGYAGRSRNPYDAVFPLGFQETRVLEGEFEIAKNALPREIPGAFNVLFLGRLNQTVLDAFEPVLQAAVRMRSGKRPCRFIFAGKGDCADALRERASGVPEIIFLGQVGTAVMEVLKQSSHAALLCISRRKDYQLSLSNKIFEYLAAGLPVASHLTGVVGGVLRDEGCGFSYDSSQGLVDGLMRWAENEDARKSAGKRARVLFERQFASRAIYPRFVSHLETLASRK